MDFKATVIEHSRVRPSSGTVPEKSLPLTLCDLSHMFYAPISALFFYSYSDCDPKILIPKLKDSLSLTLKHFFPFAGNLILHPSDTQVKHELRYVDGDSVPVTFVTCNADFDKITEKNPVCVTELLPFGAQISPSPSRVALMAPVLAIKVTFFEKGGICIGITRDHVIGDVYTWVSFVRAWALITKTSSDASFLASNYIPCFDRSAFTDTKEMYNFYSSRIENLHQVFEAKYSVVPQNNMSRCKFIIPQPEIQELKKSVLQKSSNLTQVSSFVAVSAYIWTCVVKAYGDQSKEEYEEFWCAVAARGRVHSIPDTYFGNCFGVCGVKTESAVLKGKNGFLAGAELIGGEIRKIVENPEGILECIHTLLAIQTERRKTGRVMKIAGSPKLSLHDIDFGWGNPKTSEYSYTRESVAVLHGCNDPHDALEISLSLPKHTMDAFCTIFHTGLKS